MIPGKKAPLIIKEEMLENTKMWREENADVSVESELPSMRSVGVTAGGIQSDMDQFSPETPVDDTEAEGGGEEGGAGEADAAGTESPVGSTAPETE